MVVTIHPEALAEMAEAVAFYEQRTPGLGRDLFDEIETLLQRIADHPGVGTAYDPPYRRLLCQKFPFAIIYREVEGGLNVLAVMHQRRRPGYWKRRTGFVRESVQEPSYAVMSAAT